MNWLLKKTPISNWAVIVMILAVVTNIIRVGNEIISKVF